MMNPVWLRSFCTLVDVGHFTRTAEQLHMTQSGVSQHVRKLEEYLGQPLLVRVGKGFTLTNSGEQLYREGRKVLFSLSELEQRASLDPAYEGEVKIASPGSVGLKLYPYLLLLQQAHPRLIIEYSFAPNADIERLITEHKVDIGLMTCQSTNSDISIEQVAEEALLLVTPLSQSKPDWSVLQTLGFIDHPDGAHHARLLLGSNYHQFSNSQSLRKSGFSNQLHLILEPVSMGLGFTVLPSYAVAAFNKNAHRVSAYALDNEVTETLYLGVNRQRFIANRVHTVISEIKHCLSQVDN